MLYYLQGGIAMNTFMEMQLKNMLMYLNTFETSCKLAPAKDDGKIDRQEAKQLEKIKAATDRFRRDLEKLL